MSDSLPINHVLRVLARGKMELVGLMPYGSNYTFLVRLADDEAAVVGADESDGAFAVY